MSKYYTPNKTPIDLPDFNHANPRNWFQQIEEEFQKLGIVDERWQFYHAVHKMPVGKPEDVEELLNKMPSSDPYTKLKEAILKEFDRSPTAYLYETTWRYRRFKLEELIKAMYGFDHPD